MNDREDDDRTPEEVLEDIAKIPTIPELCPDCGAPVEFIRPFGTPFKICPECERRFRLQERLPS
jgi:predicted amidophosphoribosyltransferase